MLARELMRQPTDGYRIVGVGIPGYAPQGDETLEVCGQEIPILGDEVQALAGIEAVGANTVAITGTEHFGADGIRKLLWQLEEIDVDLVVSPGVMDIAGQRLTMRPVSGLPADPRGEAAVPRCEAIPEARLRLLLRTARRHRHFSDPAHRRHH